MFSPSDAVTRYLPFGLKSIETTLLLCPLSELASHLCANGTNEDFLVLAASFDFLDAFSTAFPVLLPFVDSLFSVKNSMR